MPGARSLTDLAEQPGTISFKAAAKPTGLRIHAVNDAAPIAKRLPSPKMRFTR